MVQLFREQKDSLAVASLTVNKLKRQLDEASARMRQLQADMDQKRYYMGTFDANLAVAEKEHAAAYKLNKNLLTASNSTEHPGVMEYVHLKNEVQLLELKAADWERKLEVAQMGTGRLTN